jgi:hypothetical protein
MAEPEPERPSRAELIRGLQAGRALRQKAASEDRTMRWDTSQKFVLTKGEFDLEAESALYKEGVRREINAGSYRWACYVEAAHVLLAQSEAIVRLRRLVEPYGVEILVFDMRAVALP